MSSRISFSHGLYQKDCVPVDHCFVLSNSPPRLDFNFCFSGEITEHEASLADDLFFDGKILPSHMKKKDIRPATQLVPSIPLPPPPSLDACHDESIRNIMENELRIASPESVEKLSSKRIKRSRSFNCGRVYSRAFCHLPLLLSRSNSTSSAPGVVKQNYNKPLVAKSPSSSSASAAASTRHNSESFSSTFNRQKQPPFKKNYASYGNGFRVNPVLNVPAVNLFSLCSIFSSGKNKKKK